MDLKQLLREHFGYSDFRPGQQEAIHSILAKQDTLVVMPTGSRKSLIYQLAALMLPGTTLVISPLIALMKDQVDQLQTRHIPATFINSSLSASQQQERLQQLVTGVYRLVYIAPERLRHRAFLEAISKVKISLLAVDEAHCISQWGHDFRPDYLQIATAARSALGRPTTLALTATATPQVQDEIIAQLDLQTAQKIVTGFNRPNLTFTVRYTPDGEAKYRALREFFKITPGAGIVYVGTRRQAEEVASFLGKELGVNARHYHAGMESTARHKIQEAFMSGAIPVVVATNAFGMGVNRADLRFVLHYSIPGSLEAYYQEAGRAGRDGLPAQCILLYSPQDRELQEWFIENDVPSSEELFALYETARSLAHEGTVVSTVEDLCWTTGIHETKVKVGLAYLESLGALQCLGNEGVHLRFRIGTLDWKALETIATEIEARRAHKRRQLQKMVIYAETNSCRRRIILDHFGDPDQTPVTCCCDNCEARLTSVTPSSAHPAETTAERVALLILWTVREIHQKLHTAVGQTKLAQILAGSHSKEIERFGYDRLRAYGRLAQLRRKEISQLIAQLLEMGYLKSVGSEYPIIRLTPRGEEALRTKAAISVQLPCEIHPNDVGQHRVKREYNEKVERVVMLGESHDPQCVPELLIALHDSNGNVRRLAASALGKIRDRRAVQPLLALLKREQKPQVRQYAITALGELGDPQAYSVIEQIAHDLKEKEYNRRAAVRALKKLRTTARS
jgi:ATP-dependent DNA helicase RecQ